MCQPDVQQDSIGMRNPEVIDQAHESLREALLHRPEKQLDPGLITGTASPPSP
jgi:hypothetical protein